MFFIFHILSDMTTGQDALAKSTFEYNTESPLKGVIFDLAALLNTTPSDSGDAALEGNIVSDSHWNIGFGAREALLYLNARGIKTALLPRILIDNKQLVDGTIDVFEERMNYEFSYHAENAAQLKQVDQHLKDICLQMSPIILQNDLRNGVEKQIVFKQYLK